MGTTTAAIRDLSLGKQGVLEISHIRTDGGTQNRARTNHSVIRAYAQLMASGTEFPPVRVWFDGHDYWLSDGFQRLSAAESIARSTISAIILNGTLEDAKWDSYGSNCTHGLRRTAADVALVLERAMVHQFGSRLSNREIGRHLGIPETTVRRWRRRILPRDAEAEDGRVATRNGKSYIIRTANIGTAGKSRALVRIEPKPWSLDYELRLHLKELAELSSPRVQPLVRIWEKWLLGQVSTPVCLEVIEDILRTPRHA